MGGSAQRILVMSCRLLLLVSWLAATAASPVPRLPVRRPRIIATMLFDDLGWADTTLNRGAAKGGVSNPDVPTPHLHAMADAGVRLNQMYSQPVCSPTRATLMTARFPFRDGMQHKNTIVPGSTAAIPITTPTLPELFTKHSQSNITSAIVGKWHLGYASFNNTPIGRGFDHYVGYMQGQVDYFNKTVNVGYGKGYDFWNGDTLDRSAAGDYSLPQYEAAWERIIRDFATGTTDDGANETNTANEAQTQPSQRQQLYLFLAFQTVHIPIEAAGEDARCGHISDYWRRVYCSMIVELDDAVGRIVETLTAAVGDDFVVLAMSDNGAQVRWATYGGNKTHNKPFWPASTGDNRPLRGSKFTLFEGGVRATAFVYSPSPAFIPVQRRNSSYDGLMHACDFAATALSLGGVNLTEVAEQSLIDGIDHWDAITSGDSHSLRSHVPINIVSAGKDYSAVRFGDMKLIVGGAPTYGIKKGDGWYARGLAPEVEPAPAHKKGTPYLFNVTADPTEHNELDVDAHSDAVNEGQALLDGYVSSGVYREPQKNTPHLGGLPWLHGGAWVPWLDKL